MRVRFASGFACAALACLFTLPGCGDRIREDRTVQFSAAGENAGFQHGEDGVFVADRQTGDLVSVFKPGADVLATSTPLFAPGGTRMIFTTAQLLTHDPAGAPPAAQPQQAIEPQPPAANPANPVVPAVRWDDHPEGRPFSYLPVRYTCWLREDAGDNGAGEAPEPRALFDAVCDHSGYVAANLAVRWHPDGERILFLDIPPAGVVGQHALFEFELESGTKRQVFPHAAEALLFDWSPDGKRLACVVGSRSGGATAHDGLWIGDPALDDWWHVPDSQTLNGTQIQQLLEHLRASRPVWTRDGERFAWVRESLSADGKRQFALNLTSLRERGARVLFEGAEIVRDVHWSPDGGRLGVLIGEAPVRLYVLAPGELPDEPLTTGNVRHFAGWNVAGDRLAYVAADSATPQQPKWAFLFVVDPAARDILLIGDPDVAPPAEVFSGMRITFPQWSPDANELSLWGTFTPPYASFFSWLFHAGLRPGDPAAILNVDTGALRWLAVNWREQAQIGHHHLLKGDAAEALRWYEQAAAAMPPAAPPQAAELAPQLVAFERFEIFHWHCLTKLGRDAEARQRLDEFRRLTTPAVPAAPPAGAAPAITADEQRATGMFSRLLADLYVAEALLAVDAPVDAEAFFEATLAAAETDAERLSAAIVLGQLQLINARLSEYARLSLDQIVPLLAHVPSPPANTAADINSSGGMLRMVLLYSLLPLFTRDFLAELPADAVDTLATRVADTRDRASNTLSQSAYDQFLVAAYKRLGRNEPVAAITARVAAHADVSQRFTPQEVADALTHTRQFRGE